MSMSTGLKDKTVVITRDLHQSQNLIEKIKGLGGRVVSFPTIKIVGATNWEKCDAALSEIKNFAWIVFTSANSVRFFMGRTKYMGAMLTGVHLAAVGAKTAEELSRYNLQTELVPEDFSAKGLLRAFEHVNIKNKYILIPSSNLANEILPEGLKALGAQVTKCVVYSTLPNDSLDGKNMRMQISNSSIDCLTFFSPSAFHDFLKIVGEDTVELLSEKGVIIAAIGPVTGRAIEKKGLEVHVVPATSDEDALLEALKNYYN